MTSKIDQLTERLAKFEQLFQNIHQQNEQLRSENDQLRQAVDSQATASVMAMRGVRVERNTFGDVFVGIRNVSDTTVGIPPSFPGDPAIQLNADLGNSDPGRFGIISYAQWRELRKSDLVGRGIIMRDDSVLTGTYNAAPADRPDDVHPDHAKNLVIDPETWINERTEDQLLADLEAMNSEATLRRLQRYVEDQIRALERKRNPKTPDERVEAARRALMTLPPRLRLVDDIVTQKLLDMLPVLPQKIMA